MKEKFGSKTSWVLYGYINNRNHRTLAAWTLVILILEKLKYFFFSKEHNFVKENHGVINLILEHSIFQHGIKVLFFQFCGLESLAIFLIYCKFTLRK